jgi:drug/metabolite transporter (DMT)-like permease
MNKINNNISAKGLLYIITAVFIWAGWVIASRYSVTSKLTAFDITAIRFTAAGIFVLPIAFKKGLVIPGRTILSSVLMAFLMGAGYINIAILGMKYAPASHASTLINGSVIIVTSILSILWLHDKITKLRLLGLLISLVGMAIILQTKTVIGKISADNIAFGHLLFIIAGIMWGFYIILAKKWHTNPTQMTGIVCLVSMICYMPFYLLLADTSNINMQNMNEIIFQAIYQGFFTAIVAFVCFNRGIMIVGAARASSFIPLVPVLVAIFAIPILGEIPSLLEILGVILVSCGVLLSSGIIKKISLPSGDGKSERN